MRVALTLGSGGPRGWAHIGIIKVLEEAGHEIVAVAGTSAGALVGGIYASGKLPEFSDWIFGLTQREVMHYLDPALGSAGLIRGERVLDKISVILDGARIEDLAIPFTAVATDIDAQREVWFRHGPVAAAIRASISIPATLTPVVIRGRTYVDGGVLNPVPVDALLGIHADVTVAVDLNGASQESPIAGTPHTESTDPSESSGWWNRYIPHLSGHHPAEKKHDWTLSSAPVGPRDVAGMAINANQALLTRLRMAANPPDVLISVPTDAAGGMDYHHAPEMAEMGRILAEEALSKAGLL